MEPSAYRMQWFGEQPWALLCQDCERVAVPVGEVCLHCGEVIAPGEDGVMQVCITRDAPPSRHPAHAECNFRASMGGANHIRGTCSCCGGTEQPDPPGLTRRAAAWAAVAAARQQEEA